MRDFAAVIGLLLHLLIILLRSALAMTQIRIGLSARGPQGLTPTDGTRLAITDGARLGAGVLELKLLPLEPLGTLRRLQHVAHRAHGTKRSFKANLHQ